MATVPVWVWLPGHDLPVQAGELAVERAVRFAYLPAYLAHHDALPLDPVELRLARPPCARICDDDAGAHGGP